MENAYAEPIKALATHVFPFEPYRSAEAVHEEIFKESAMAMMTREFVSMNQQINDYLQFFPPFNDEQNLPEDALIDILEFLIPKFMAGGLFGWDMNL